MLKSFLCPVFDTSSRQAAATLSSCESEQLHLSGRIQQHGALLVVACVDGCVSHASANCEVALGLPLEHILNKPLTQLPFYSPDFAQGFSLEAGAQIPLVNFILPNGAAMDVTLVRSRDALLLEWEPSQRGEHPIAIHQMHRSMVRAPSHKGSISEYYDMLVGYIRDITGMDRVMIYRFREDWSGEVVAEAVLGDRGSYMDMRFPAGDIPEIARKLYLQNPYRMIPDVAAEDHSVLSLHEQPPDLTYSDLRSVSPMHLQYMRNMGVSASFSVPIIINGQLWGLVACHHYQGALLLNQDQRHASVTLVSAFALGLASHIAGMHLQLLDSMERRIQLCLHGFAGLANPLDGVGSSGLALAGLVKAEGFAMAIDEQAAISGTGPDLEGLGVIDDWLLNHSEESLVAIERLSEKFAGYPEVGQAASGLLAVKVWTSSRGWLRFYWFREAETQHITWAGNPDKPKAENAGVSHLSPRRSFERWVETRTGYSREWTGEDRLMASKFRSSAGRLL